jgi:hypothetical protein
MINQAGGFEPSKILRKESSHEQGKIADVAMDIPFTVQ